MHASCSLAFSALQIGHGDNNKIFWKQLYFEKSLRPIIFRNVLFLYKNNANLKQRRVLINVLSW